VNERDEARVIRNPTATVSGDLFALTLDFFRFAFETLSVIFAFLCTEAKNWSLLIKGLFISRGCQTWTVVRSVEYNRP
jgi:hypothetical protein